MTSLAEPTITKMPLVERVRAAKLPPPAERRRIRLNAKATLQDIADELGTTPATVSRWERGEDEPKLRFAVPYRRLLDQLNEAAS